MHLFVVICFTTPFNWVKFLGELPRSRVQGRFADRLVIAEAYLGIMLINNSIPDNSTTSLPATSTVDESMLERVARREPEAFEELMRQYRPLLNYLIRESVGGGPRARMDHDDAMQEICVAIWQAAERFDPMRGSEKTFIAMVARRRLIDRYYRRATRISTHEFASEAIDSHADRRSHERSSSLPEAAERALASLEPENRHLLELAVVHGKSSTEIARATGLRINTVKTRIHRALSRVRSSVEIDRLAA